LLLYGIAKKFNFTFSRYNLIPIGSFSKIEKIDDGTIYELYGSNDSNFSRLFLGRPLDLAIVAYLECLQEISKFAETKDKQLQLPYQIKGELIGTDKRWFSVKLQFNKEEEWTKALKCILTNLKYLLASCARTASTSMPQ